MRSTILLALLCILSFSPHLASADPHCCITEGFPFYNDPKPMIEKRFALYRQIGIGMVRVEADWAVQEPVEGKWIDPPSHNFLDCVAHSGLKVKMISGTLMGPPGWVLAKHPDARIIDEDGKSSDFTMSFWYPGLHQMLDDAMTHEMKYLVRSGLSKNISEVVVDCGPAGEAIYPALWTLGPGFDHQPFWFYDNNAQADFRAKMRVKYGTIAAANTAWQSTFADWDAVVIPKPGQRSGKFWDDVLTWYRQSKRDFIVWHIKNVQQHIRKYLGPNVKADVYLPGFDVRDQEWQDAVNTGSGDDNVRLMVDNRWLIETAAKMGCFLQYTGVDNAAETAYLRNYMNTHGLSNAPIWGENTGVESIAKDPITLGKIVVQNRLWGLDYTTSEYAFGPDHITPNQAFWDLQKACAAINTRKL